MSGIEPLVDGGRFVGDWPVPSGPQARDLRPIASVGQEGPNGTAPAGRPTLEMAGEERQAHAMLIKPSATTASPPPAATCGVVAIRRITAGDVGGLERFYAELGPDSRRTRFFCATRGLAHPQAVLFCTPDHDHDEGFVAVVRDDGGEHVVGHLCIDVAGREAAELALAVADAFQGQGIGTRLTAAGIAWARASGIRYLTATFLVGNIAIQRLLAGLGFAMRTRFPDAGISETVIDLLTPSVEAA